MSCPDWSQLTTWRDRLEQEGGGGPEEWHRAEDAWHQALSHLDDCPSCQTEALAEDPTLLFQHLPVPEIGDEEIEAMKQGVAALRRVQPSQQPLRRFRRPTVWAQAAVAAGVLLAVSLWTVLSPQGPGSDPAGVVVFAPQHVPASFLQAQTQEPAAEVDAKVEVQGDRIVVSGPQKAVATLARQLEELDRPPVDLALDIRLLQASSAAAGAALAGQGEQGDLLRELDYGRYEELASTVLDTKEHEAVTSDIIESAVGHLGYSFKFELGAFVQEQMKLRGLRVLKHAIGPPGMDKGPRLDPLELLELDDLAVHLGQETPVVVSEGESTLVVVVTFRRSGEGAAGDS